MKPISLTLLLILLCATTPTFAADSTLHDDSVDSKFSDDNAASVSTQAVKPNHPKAGIGDGMIGTMHKHPAVIKPQLVPMSPAGPTPAPPPPPKTAQ